MSEQPQVEYASIRQAMALFALSRNGLYRLAAQGRIRMVAHGNRTLVAVDSVRGYLASLPAPKLRSPKP